VYYTVIFSQEDQFKTHCAFKAGWWSAVNMILKLRMQYIKELSKRQLLQCFSSISPVTASPWRFLAEEIPSQKRRIM
jgi:hypothetical protein